MPKEKKTEQTDDWEWKPITVACDECGAENALHEQPPEMMKAGVVWECSSCGKRQLLGGDEPQAAAFGGLLECGQCHSTYTDESERFDELGLNEDGEWTCVACGTANKAVAATDGGNTAEKGVARS